MLVTRNRIARRLQDRSTDMKHSVVTQILIALIVSIAGAYAMTNIQVATIDAREQTRATETERAIERVKRDAEQRADRDGVLLQHQLEKIDTNVQWLIKHQIETRALINRKVSDQ